MSLHITQRFNANGTAVTVNLHDLKSVRDGEGRGWGTFTDDVGSSVVIHVDARLAEMLPEAFDEYENWMSGQEGPTFDSALGAKCDALARVDEARRLK